MSQALAQFVPSHEFDVDEQRFLQVLESMRHWTSINLGHQNEKRTTERMDFFGNPVMALKVPSDAEDVEPLTVSFRVWGRDLSRSGMSCVIASTAEPAPHTHGCQVKKLEKVLGLSPEVTVGLGRPEGGRLWLAAQVLRVRAVHHGLFECGVGFLRRVDGPPA